jgi:hypothetical protein
MLIDQQPSKTVTRDSVLPKAKLSQPGLAARSWSLTDEWRRQRQMYATLVTSIPYRNHLDYLNPPKTNRLTARHGYRELWAKSCTRTVARTETRSGNPSAGDCCMIFLASGQEFQNWLRASSWLKKELEATSRQESQAERDSARARSTSATLTGPNVRHFQTIPGKHLSGDSLKHVNQRWVGIDGHALPPVLVRPKFENCEMKMRS